MRRSGAVAIAVNDAYRIAPWAQHLYACDANWWNLHYDEVLKTFHGKKWSQTEQPRIKFKSAKGITLLQSSEEAGLKTGALCRGSNSGYQAVNLAYILGARRIILIGYDMHGKGTHFFGKHPAPLTNNTDYESFIAAFRAMNPKFYGVEVINCTRRTAIPEEVFKRMELKSALALPRR